MAPRAAKPAKLSKDEKETVAALKELKADKRPLKKQVHDKKTEGVKSLMQDSDLRARLKKKVIDSRAAETVNDAPRRPRRRIPSPGECNVKQTGQTESKKPKATRARRV
jgi:hypothetical protein